MDCTLDVILLEEAKLVILTYLFIITIIIFNYFSLTESDWVIQSTQRTVDPC